MRGEPSRRSLSFRSRQPPATWRGADRGRRHSGSESRLRDQSWTWKTFWDSCCLIGKWILVDDDDVLSSEFSGLVPFGSDVETDARVPAGISDRFHRRRGDVAFPRKALAAIIQAGKGEAHRTDVFHDSGAHRSLLHDDREFLALKFAARVPRRLEVVLEHSTDHDVVAADTAALKRLAMHEIMLRPIPGIATGRANKAD